MPHEKKNETERREKHCEHRSCGDKQYTYRCTSYNLIKKRLTHINSVNENRWEKSVIEACNLYIHWSTTGQLATVKTNMLQNRILHRIGLANPISFPRWRIVWIHFLYYRSTLCDCAWWQTCRVYQREPMQNSNTKLCLYKKCEFFCSTKYQSDTDVCKNMNE